MVVFVVFVVYIVFIVLVAFVILVVLVVLVVFIQLIQLVQFVQVEPPGFATSVATIAIETKRMSPIRVKVTLISKIFTYHVSYVPADAI